MGSPLTPPDCDLRDFPRMMIDINRLRGSEFDSTLDDAAWRAGLNLWLTAWHQVPTASLPADDANLAKAAGLGRDVKTWRKVKDVALRGWKLCDDGKLYHQVIAEIALEVWIDKLGQRVSSGAGNAKRYEIAFDPDALYADIRTAAAMLETLNRKSKALAKQHVMKARKMVAGTAPGSPPGVPVGGPLASQGKGREGKGQERKDANASSAASAAPKTAKAKPKGDPWSKDAHFAVAWLACTDQMRRRSSRPKAWAKWRANPADGADKLAALRAYLKIDPDVQRTGGPGLHLWLADKLDEWLAEPTQTAAVTAHWAGPADVRQAVERGFNDPAKAASYLRTFSFDEADRVLHSPNGFAVDEIRKAAGGELSAITVKVLVRKAKAA